MSLFAFFALGVLAGRSVARAFEMHVALSPCSAAAKQEFFAIAYKIGNWNCRLLRIRRWTFDVGHWAFFFFRPPDNRPHRYFHDFVRACASAHFFPHPVPAVFGLDDRLVEKIR